MYIDFFGGLVCSFPAAIFWIFLGKIFAEKKIKIKSTALLIILTICSCIALFVEWKFVISLDGSYNNDSYFMLAPLCVLLFLGVEKIAPIYWKNSVYFKRASTIIYVAHGSLLPVVSKLTSIVFKVQMPLLSFVFTFIGCITIYTFVEIAIKKCRKHRINKTLKMLYWPLRTTAEWVHSAVVLCIRLFIAQQNLSIGVIVVSKGSPSLILRVLLISLGITIQPRSSTLLTMPVAFIYLSPFTIHLTGGRLPPLHLKCWCVL